MIQKNEGSPEKRYPTIACCGIDCGLCPRYHSTGSSKCPGCAGQLFSEKHPSCGIITCCVKNKRLEVCAQCDEFPCPRLHKWDAADSFVTHLRSLTNLREIRADGLEKFIARQQQRIDWLEKTIDEYDDGRSRSFLCQAAALLPLPVLELAISETKRIVSDDKQTGIKALRSSLQRLAEESGISLTLRNKR